MYSNVNLKANNCITNDLISNTNIKVNSNKLIYVNKLNITNNSLNNDLLALLFKSNLFNKAIRLNSSYYVFFDTITNSYYLLSNKKVNLNSRFIKNLLSTYLVTLKRYDINKSNRLAYNTYSNSIIVGNMINNKVNYTKPTTKKTIYQRNLKNYTNFNKLGTFNDYYKVISSLDNTTINSFYNKIYNANVNKNQLIKQLDFKYTFDKSLSYKIKPKNSFKPLKTAVNLSNYLKDKQTTAKKGFNSYNGSYSLR